MINFLLQIPFVYVDNIIIIEANRDPADLRNTFFRTLTMYFHAAAQVFVGRSEP